MNFARPEGKVAVIGGANMDITGIPLSVFLPKDSNPGKVEFSPGGVARNICENLSKMGANTVLFTAIGDDANGKEILRSCSNVDTSRILISSTLPTSIYLSVNDDSGDMYCAVSDMEITELVTPEYISTHENIIDECRAIVIDTNIPGRTIEYIGQRFAHIPIFADPVSVAKAGKLLPILSKIHTIKPNSHEAALLSGMETENRSSALEAARSLRRKGIKNVALSMGQQGLFICGEHEEKDLSPPPAQIASANGAGDALMAGLVLSSLMGFNISDTLKVSCSAAKITLESSHTVSENMSFENLFLEVSRL